MVSHINRLILVRSCFYLQLKYLINKTHSSGPEYSICTPLKLVFLCSTLKRNDREEGEIVRRNVTNGAKLFTSSSDTSNSFNQHWWCLETSAYGGIKFTSWSDVQQERLCISPISFLFSLYRISMYVCMQADVAWLHYLRSKSAKWKC